MKEILLEVEGLVKEFKLGKRSTIRAVDDISFKLYRGEVLSIVGESGSGKSTLARTLLGIYRPDSGRVLYSGMDVGSVSKSQHKDFRKKAQMIFQDPYSSINPRLTIEELVSEGFKLDEELEKYDYRSRASELLGLVGLSDEFCSRYGHELSGGQLQRLGIARALGVNPEFMVCDEPISALDVSVQSQIINLLLDLKEKLNLTYLFVAHDLSMVKYISDRVGVMYRGKLIELGNCKDIFERPLHPYTKSLLDSAPKVYEETQDFKCKVESDKLLGYEVKEGGGCEFKNSCSVSEDVCLYRKPILREVRAGHFVACCK